MKDLCNGQGYGPARLSEAELGWIKGHAAQPLFHDEMPRAVKFHYPEWMESTLQELFGKKLPEAMEAMNREAPVDLRVNTLKTTRDALVKALDREGLEPELTPHSEVGVRLNKRGPLFGLEIFRQGWFEMQDEGSQLVSRLVQAKSGDKGVDFCAGAGGKTLALAAEMENRGRILAWDISGKRLGQMKPRLGRAGVSNVQARVLKNERDNIVKRHLDSADWVLLDVPCTGTGTWRRSPDLRRRTTPEAVIEIKKRQQAILESASRLVKVGGRLIYATCSILTEENENQVEAFLQVHPQFEQADPFLRLYPHTDGTDGFFGAVLHKS
jgi:16S rRNA (cytosine967-C5)-methyltransferase